MDIQLKELIDKIKQDGIASADTQAQEIIAKAEDRARQIVTQAKAEAEKTKQAAEADAHKFTQAGKAAVQQSARDVILQTQNRLENILSQLVHAKVKESFTADILEKAVVSLMANWKGQSAEDLSLFIADDVYTQVEKTLRKELSDHLTKGMEIHPSEKVAAGFRIGEKDGSSFFEISAESLAALLAARVNSSLGEIISAAAQQG